MKGVVGAALIALLALAGCRGDANDDGNPIAPERYGPTPRLALPRGGGPSTTPPSAPSTSASTSRSTSTFPLDQGPPKK